MILNLHSIFENYARELNRFFRRRGHNAETAADLTQDTFLRVLNSSSEAAPKNPRAYLHQIARNLSIDLYRREEVVKQVQMTDEEWQKFTDQMPSPEIVVYDRQRLQLIERALNELEPRTRRAFELHLIDGKTIKEVGAELDLSTSRSWVLIKQAYLHLRKALSDADAL